MTSSSPEPVRVEVGEATHEGSYTVDRDMVAVAYGSQTKKAHLGGFADAPQVLARLLLREMVTEQQGNSDETKN